MILSEKLAAERLASPLNLMNRLKSLSAATPKKDGMKIFFPSPASPIRENKTFAPKPQAPVNRDIERPVQQTIHPGIENLIPNSDKQVELALAHDRALGLLNTAITTLATKLDDVKPERLPSVIAATSKVVESIRKERSEAAKQGANKEVHYHFYTPQQNKVTDYQIIDVLPSASSDQVSA